VMRIYSNDKKKLSKEVRRRVENYIDGLYRIT
jgi:hypothetical protein